MQQIQALLAEKASRTPAQRKIDSHLLFALKRQRRDPLFQALPSLRSSITIGQDGRVAVDIRAEVSDGLLVAIEALGGIMLNAVPQYDAIRARLPLDQLETLAARPEVRSIRPAEQFMNNMLNTSEGVVAHQADTARTTYGVDGSGVTVGVLSDGVDSLAALQGTGDLPPGVTVLPGQAGSGSEGTAMLEIYTTWHPARRSCSLPLLAGRVCLPKISSICAPPVPISLLMIFFILPRRPFRTVLSLTPSIKSLPAVPFISLLRATRAI